jgi:hypothetical protein
MEKGRVIMLGPMPRSILRCLTLCWWFLIPGVIIWLTRMVYERSLLTWRRGPQMEGFSFFHLHPAIFMISASSILLSRVWLILAALILVSNLELRLRQQWIRFVLVVLVSIVPVFLPSYYSEVLIFVLLIGLATVIFYKRQGFTTVFALQASIMTAALALDTIPSSGWQLILRRVFVLSTG